MSLTPTDLATLAAPFPEERLGVKVQSLSKAKDKAMLVLYLQHTDVYDRLEKVDPNWTVTVLDERRDGDTVYTRVKLTLLGISRENVGEGGDPKSATSDALKRAAMLFGVGRYLYDSDTVWVDYDEKRDRYRTWTKADHDRAAKRQGKTVTPVGESEQASAPPPPPAAPAAAPTSKAPAPTSREPGEDDDAPSVHHRTEPARQREELNRRLMNLYRPFLTQYPQTQFKELLDKRYGVGETRLMTVEQLEDLIRHMSGLMQTVEDQPAPEAAVDATRQKRAKLFNEVATLAAKLKLPLETVSTVCQKEYGAALDDLGMEDLTKLVSRLRTRAKKETAK